MEKLFNLIYDLKKDLSDLEAWLEDLEQDPENVEIIDNVKSLISDYIIVNALNLEDEIKGV